MVELSFKPASSSRPGSWSVDSDYDGRTLVFTESWRDDVIEVNMARSRVARAADFILTLFSILGVFSLLLHFFSPLGELWFDVFLFSLFLGLINWTRNLPRKSKDRVDGNVVDIRGRFSRSALSAVRKSIMARRDKTAHPVHLFIQLLGDSKVQMIL